MGVWYLKAHGETKLVADWGLTIEALAYRSMVPAELILVEGGHRASAGDLFAFNDEVELFYQTDPDDAGTRVRRFVGAIVSPDYSQAPSFAFKYYVAQNAWRLLAKDRFRQSVAIAAPPGQAVTFALQTWEHVFLGYKVVANSTPGALPYAAQRITNGAQILEALNWCLGTAAAVGMATPFQVAAGNLPAVLAPVDEARSIACAEVVQNQMRWSPGVAYFDHATTPPTLHVAPYAALAPITVAIPGAAEVDVRELPDLKIDAVALTYQVRGADGSYTPVKDIWPIGASDRGFAVFAATIDVAGPTIEEFSVESELIEPTDLEWFKATFPEMADPGAAQALADERPRITDLAINLIVPNTYARQLVSDSVPEWIGAAIRETMEWVCTYNERDYLAGNDPVDGQPGRVVRGVIKHKTKEITTTNVASGTYRRVIDAGDTVPPTGAGGVANMLYNGLHQVQRIGRLPLHGAEPRFDITIGNLLNLTGGKPEWETMNAAVQGVIIYPQRKRTEIEFGWPEHLDLPTMLELYRVTRDQYLLNVPQQQAGQNPFA